VRLLVSMRMTVPDPASRRVLRTHKGRDICRLRMSPFQQGFKRCTGAQQYPISAAPSCPKAEPKTRMRLAHERSCYHIWFRFDCSILSTRTASDDRVIAQELAGEVESQEPVNERSGTTWCVDGGINALIGLNWRIISSRRVRNLLSGASFGRRTVEPDGYLTADMCRTAGGQHPAHCCASKWSRRLVFGKSLLRPHVESACSKLRLHACGTMPSHDGQVFSTLRMGAKSQCPWRERHTTYYICRPLHMRTGFAAEAWSNNPEAGADLAIYN
jgi:hypothetical protein